MMYLAEISFVMILFVLLASVCLFIWSLRHEGTPGAGLAKFFGIIAIVLSILTMLCTLYYGLIYWQQGAFKNLAPIAGMQMHGKSNMQSME